MPQELTGDKQRELDRIAQRREAGVERTETKRQKWNREEYPWIVDRLSGGPFNKPYPYDEEDDRAQDIRLSPGKRQETQRRAMRLKDKEK